MSKAFDHTSSEKATASQSYHAFLETDKQLDALHNDVPAWLREGGDATGMPESIIEVRLILPIFLFPRLTLLAQSIRITFRISLHHKILSVHRPFLAKPSRGELSSFWAPSTSLTPFPIQQRPRAFLAAGSSSPPVQSSARLLPSFSTSYVSGRLSTTSLSPFSPSSLPFTRTSKIRQATKMRCEPRSRQRFRRLRRCKTSAGSRNEGWAW
jgi:hypothetical protein